MKKKLPFLIAIIFLIGTTLSYGQTYVDPGEGTLSAAIEAASDGDVLLLIAGEEYTEPGNVFGIIDKSLTIQVEVEAGVEEYVKPKLYFTTDDGTGRNFFRLRDGASLTIIGVEVDGNINGSVVANHFMQADVTDALVETWINKVSVKDSYIHDLVGDAFNAGNSDMKELVVTDSTFVDNCVFYNIHTTVYYKQGASNYIELTNSTFHKITSYGVRIAGPAESGDFDNTAAALIDHTTWYDIGSEDGREVLLLEKGPNLKPWIVRNTIIQNQANKGKTMVNLKDNPADVHSEVYNLCWWDVGVIKFEGNGNTVHDTLSVDPLFADPENGDFTLPAGSELLTFGSDGGAIGDPRWATNAPTDVNETESLPTEISLSQNYPNPFNPSTKISFSLPESGLTKLVVYDLLGRMVATIVNENLSAGNHEVQFNAENLTSGMYLYRLTSKDITISQKMLLLK